MEIIYFMDYTNNIWKRNYYFLSKLFFSLSFFMFLVCGDLNLLFKKEIVEVTIFKDFLLYFSEFKAKKMKNLNAFKLLVFFFRKDNQSFLKLR